MNGRKMWFNLKITDVLLKQFDAICELFQKLDIFFIQIFLLLRLELFIFCYYFHLNCLTHKSWSRSTKRTGYSSCTVYYCIKKGNWGIRLFVWLTPQCGIHLRSSIYPIGSLNRGIQFGEIFIYVRGPTISLCFFTFFVNARLGISPQRF